MGIREFKYTSKQFLTTKVTIRNKKTIIPTAFHVATLIMSKMCYTIYATVSWELWAHVFLWMKQQEFLCKRR